MNGKKAASILVGIIVLVSILVVIAIQFFFATYEPPTSREEIQMEQSSKHILRKTLV